MPGLLGILLVAQRGVCSIVCPVFVPCAKCLGDLAGNIPCVLFIYDVQKRGKLGGLLVIAVHSAVNGDKTDAQLREPHFCIHSHFQIVTAKPGKVCL